MAEGNKDYVLDFIEAPSFGTGIATGVALNGPSGDGHLHLHFYRDRARLKNEVFDANEKDRGVELTSRPNGVQSEFVREIIASVSLPPVLMERLKALIEAHAGAGK